MTVSASGAGGAAAAPEAAARPWLSRANPAAKLVAALLVAAGLVPVVDPVTSGVPLLATLALAPFAGVERRRLLVAAGSLLLMGASVGLVNLLFGEAGPVGALGVVVRLLAIALPGVLVALSTDPTDLADALVQRLRVPERPALGVLAGLRLVPLLAGQWRALALARRARGLEAGRNPAAALGVFAGMTFALLVRAIRTGTLLAMAMDARAFGTGPRTHARTSRWRASDTWLVAGTVLLLCAAHALSVALGTWRPLFR
ncbi:energy-coupling factor transporter transmembrane component T family protein [Marinitenerispora sediminis]|uniref:Cobalt ABC transporter n=1 Tax=Marinitenerispora sediminis TaxID=1931232 RepID=A0A368T489_9ACTN|nr:energy-coupling factor transporter transmembrane component T [Marinitenerispora sediminis]RCV51238.1 cobalt ABC transporter [Marinitenerispora sediminis]RCV55766.1 cobalt ABC transporter [Marinitenerispora sediminis]RCV57527.1 cobalt ABC transporter [Marinitenerispora sediminis]